MIMTFSVRFTVGIFSSVYLGILWYLLEAGKINTSVFTVSIVYLCMVVGCIVLGGVMARAFLLLVSVTMLIGLTTLCAMRVFNSEGWEASWLPALWSSTTLAYTVIGLVADWVLIVEIPRPSSNTCVSSQG